jgi:hypothetical protein
MTFEQSITNKVFETWAQKAKTEYQRSAMKAEKLIGDLNALLKNQSAGLYLR